ncbi:hypothetical protein BH10ACI1_BH10ACI1_07790 [soil metagenome]
MAKTVTAKEGDSLCNIAFQNGFGDCTALRDEPKNKFILDRTGDEKAQLRTGDKVTVPKMTIKDVDGATEQRHKFVKRGTLAILRFVHGAKDTSFKNDRTLTFLNVSNFITNLAGAPDGAAATPFPGSAIRDFNADADKDKDAFKVEVLDINGSGELEVELEVLKPVYDAKGKVTKHEQFPAAIRADRQLKPKASKQGATQRFRTCYLRLVVDEADKGKNPAAAFADQTLLASDMYDKNNADSKKVEILDQKVKGFYIIKTCPKDPKCRSTAILPIGEDRRRIRLAVHILRDKALDAGGTEVVSRDDVEKRLFTWFRRVYAQANIAPKLISIDIIDPPENLVSISNDDGARANGTESLGFRLNAKNHPSQTIGPITAKRRARPIDTARALAKEIKAPYHAVVAENAARLDAATNNDKSCDIVITVDGNELVTIDNVVTPPAPGHTLTVGRVRTASVPRAPFSFSGIIGTVEQRALFRNHDTKFKANDDTVDVFVVDKINPDVRGTATISGHRTNAARQAVPKVRCSVLMSKLTIDGTDKNPFTFPHEFGHVAGECGHVGSDAAGNSIAPAQMMTGDGTSTDNAVDGSKRIRDEALRYDDGTFNLITRIRRESAALLEKW